MHKLLVLYPEPTDRAAFEEYYVSKHLPLAATLPGLTSWDYTLNVSPGPDGAPAPYFAVFEAAFPDTATFGAAMSSATGQAVAADVPNYATGGAVVLDFPVIEGD
jgi:uncharacterized protein (TIGR02118 family)